MLHISKWTLQYLRTSGKLPYSTIGNKCYYKPGDVKVLLDKSLTTEQIMVYSHISRRALQNYRDKGIIFYTSIGGTLFYPESEINEVLENNYYKPSL